MTLAQVNLWGTRIGAVRWSSDGLGAFEYDLAFRDSLIEVSPITMPLGARVYEFAGLERATFHGLPGLLADSLPDKYGTALIDAWLVRTGRQGFNPVDRLCYIGSRSMGALEYEPAIDAGRPDASSALQIEQLLDLANAATAGKEALQARLSESGDEDGAIANIVSVGTSAGGARAKAVVAWNPSTGEIRSGQTETPDGFGHWLMKFDGVSGNADKEAVDPQGFGRIEFAYHLMAVAAGIEMTECRLYEESGRAHFMTRRFDRVEGGKLHAVTLGGLAHLDFNQARAHSYEQAADVASTIGCSASDQVKLLRRAAFNIAARNQDDHTKNISFLMDRQGRWSLSPAYDVTYSYNPDGAWTSQHQMSLAGKTDNFVLDDLRTYADFVGVNNRTFDEVIEGVTSAVAGWPGFAEEAKVSLGDAERVGRSHRKIV